MSDFNWKHQATALKADLIASFLQWRFWAHLGWNDIAKQYRRSFLGPIWITLNTAIFIVAFGLVGAQLFSTPLNEYLVYFCTGQVIFGYLSSMLADACVTFTSAEAFLKQSACAKSLFISRTVFRNVLLLAHSFVVVILSLLWFDGLGNVHWPELVLAFLVVTSAAWLMVGTLALVATRFRDVPMIVTSVIQIAYFVTPVMWKPEQLTTRGQLIVDFNPIAQLLQLMRLPLLGKEIPSSLWTYCTAIIVVLTVVFLGGFLTSRKKIVYWV